MVTTVSTGNGFLTPAVLGYRKLAQSAEDSAARLASGNRILRIGDDASGVSIASRLQTQIFKYRQAVQDVATSDTLVDVAKNGLEAIRTRLERAAELAKQANSSVLLDRERLVLQQQFSEALEEADRIVQDTRFNSQNLLDGGFADKDIRVGPEDNDFINIAISDVSSEGLFGEAAPVLTSQPDAAAAETTVQDALKTVGDIIGALSGTKEALVSASGNANNVLSGVSRAENAITGTDTEEEIRALAEKQIKLNVGSAVIAQASRISNELLGVLEFKIEIDRQSERSEAENKEEKSTDVESSANTDVNADKPVEAT